MKKFILNNFNNYIDKINTIYKVKYALAAISGGSDSICLMKLLSYYKKSQNLTIHYIYVDHQWNSNSSIHIKHLINQIKYYGLHITIYQMHNITDSETNARKIRYNIILNHALKNKYTAILTGHNSTDKIETFIQQIIRGTSINGATSLTFMNKIKKIFFFVLLLIIQKMI